MFHSIKFEEKEQIGFLTINKPEVLNALDAQVLKEIGEAVGLAETKSEIKALIVTGEGRAFAAGADIGAQSVLDLEGGKMCIRDRH